VLTIFWMNSIHSSKHKIKATGIDGFIFSTKKKMLFLHKNNLLPSSPKSGFNKKNHPEEQPFSIAQTHTNEAKRNPFLSFFGLLLLYSD
jgi:hypothetical protein